MEYKQPMDRAGPCQGPCSAHQLHQGCIGKGSRYRKVKYRCSGTTAEQLLHMTYVQPDCSWTGCQIPGPVICHAWSGHVLYVPLLSKSTLRRLGQARAASEIQGSEAFPTCTKSVHHSMTSCGCTRLLCGCALKSGDTGQRLWLIMSTRAISG